jgi:hypothetical protein
MVGPASGYPAFGELLWFDVAPDGRVTRMSTANSYWLRK